MRTYEGMFLVDPTKASTEWNKVMQHIKDILSKHKSRLLQTNKWAEHKLAYPIKQRQRGTYILTYFETLPENIAKIKSDCRLSEIILRIMILVKPEKRIAQTKTGTKKQPTQKATKPTLNLSPSFLRINSANGSGAGPDKPSGKEVSNA